MTQTQLRRILLAEDEPDIQIIARMALTSLGGFELEICGNGKEVLARSGAFMPDLIVLDVMMPVMDGPETLRLLRQDAQLSAIPVIFMTAKIQPPEVDHYRQLGALGVIAKPFDPMQLPAQILALWQGALRS